ncbi:MAG TPA: DUF2007 domain-containing protein [Dehalococcoidia bacterium]|nr:DUF2007 domain-containing protein [Dehalococcoidia bacterium]
MRWAYLATAPDQLTAEVWVSLLRDSGIAAMIHPADTSSFLGAVGFGTRVQVAEDRLEEGREVLGVDEDGSA